MSNLLPEFLSNIFPSTSELRCLVSDFNRRGTDSELSGSNSVDVASFLPEDSKIVSLQGECGFEKIRELIQLEKHKSICIWPPFIGRNMLSKEFRNKFPKSSFEDFVVAETIETLEENDKAAFILPVYAFRNKLIKHLILEKTKSHILADLILKNPSFRVAVKLLVVEIGVSKNRTSKFFSSIEDKNSEILINDFCSLLKRKSGSTEYGYVYKGEINPDEPLSYARYHPDFLLLLKSLNVLGASTALEQMGEFVKTKNHSRVSDNNQLRSGVPEIRGRDIAFGSINLPEPDSKEPLNTQLDTSAEYFLRTGDICFSEMISFGGQIRAAIVKKDDLPLTHSHSVVVFRPSKSLSDSDRQILFAYLTSDIACNWLSVYGSSTSIYSRIYPSTLGSMPVPNLDTDIRTSVQNLDYAAEKFKEWQEEIENAKSLIFTTAILEKDSKSKAFSIGRIVRQRTDAAKLVDDFEYRARTRLPYPIAHKWSTVKSSYSDLEGYTHILECAENVVCYMAQVAIVIADRIGVKISALKTISERITNRKPGTNMGDWISILREVRGKKFRRRDIHTPFYEILTFLSPETDKVLSKLSERRNDNSHGRGPKGAQVTRAYNDSLKELECFLKYAELLSEYPLRYVEETRRDSLNQVTYYKYRDLMGDNLLVPLREARINNAELEAGSLYLVDRDKQLYLLRPLLHRQRCPECDVLSTFFLENYDKKNKSVVLKSLEHEHTFSMSSFTENFRKIGLID